VLWLDDVLRSGAEREFCGWVLGLGNMAAFAGIGDLVVAIHAATAANGQCFSFAITGGGARAAIPEFHMIL
jgi:hypothetical protein